MKRDGKAPGHCGEMLHALYVNGAIGTQHAAYKSSGAEGSRLFQLRADEVEFSFGVQEVSGTRTKHNVQRNDAASRRFPQEFEGRCETVFAQVETYLNAVHTGHFSGDTSFKCFGTEFEHDPAKHSVILAT
jgi:hypothetical protein